jgi:hypothetical protein
MMRILQPALFDVSEETIGTAELFPAVWAAAEDLVSPFVENRKAALDQLETIGAARFSPLIAYLLATRVSDPDLEVRSQVIRILGDLLGVDKHGLVAMEPIRQYLAAFFRQMRTRTVFDLLQTADIYPEIDIYIARLMNLCSFAGKHLVEIVTDRKHPMSIRIQAARFIGIVGYLDAAQAMERLSARLETRLKGQQALPFNRASDVDEVNLLPHIHHALMLLRQP